MEHQGVYKEYIHPCIPGSNWNLKTQPEKTLWSSVENQQQRRPTNDTTEQINFAETCMKILLTTMNFNCS